MVRKKILYIGGYGRSGSTLLCAVLGGAVDAVPVGELKVIFSYYSVGRQCSCSKKIKECEFWSAVVQAFLKANPDISLEEATRTTETVESYKNWLMLRYKGSEIEQRYYRIWRSMIDIICELSNSRVIIDASKSSSIACNRAAALSKVVDVQQIHLVRDPRSVMASMFAAQKRRLSKHGIKPVPFRGVRTLLAWSSTNFYIHLLSALGLQKVKVRISYEQLTNQPKKALLKLSEEIDIDADYLIAKIDKSITFSAGHIFSGDLQRLKGEYRISAQAVKWPEQLNAVQHSIAWLTYPLARSYGYLRILNRKS